MSMILFMVIRQLNKFTNLRIGNNIGEDSGVVTSSSHIGEDNLKSQQMVLVQ